MSRLRSAINSLRLAHQLRCSGSLIVLEPEAFFEAIESGATKSDDPAILAADKIVSIEFTSPRTCLCKVEIAELNEDGEVQPVNELSSFRSPCRSQAVILAVLVHRL